MSLTLHLLTAGLLLGQTEGPSVIPTRTTAQPYVISSSPAVPAQGGRTLRSTLESRPILSRIQGWFSRRAERGTEIQPSTGEPPIFTPSAVPAGTPTPTPAGGDYQKLPTTSSNGGTQVVDTVSLKAVNQGAPSPILPGLANKIGRDEKFEWVTGQLVAEKGSFKLYYATPETVDPHNGVVLLNTSKADMRTYRSGDLVSVRGQLTQRNRATPTYQATDINLIERPERK